MSEDLRLIAAAESLERKSADAEQKAKTLMAAAPAGGDSTTMTIAMMEGVRSAIYWEVAGSLREAGARAIG